MKESHNEKEIHEKQQSLDLFGPYSIKSMVRSKTQLKVWGIVFGCLTTGALHCEIAADYSTDAFFIAFAAFTALRGMLSFIHSDKGSQLARVQQDLEESLR